MKTNISNNRFNGFHILKNKKIGENKKMVLLGRDTKLHNPQFKPWAMQTNYST
jgi:hypothetical protein